LIRCKSLSVRPLEIEINIRLEVMMNVNAARIRGGTGKERMKGKEPSGADTGHQSQKISPGVVRALAHLSPI